MAHARCAMMHVVIFLAKRYKNRHRTSTDESVEVRGAEVHQSITRHPSWSTMRAMQTPLSVMSRRKKAFTIGFESRHMRGTVAEDGDGSATRLVVVFDQVTNGKVNTVALATHKQPPRLA